ncbi:MAG TPA: hypothetical protein VLW54_14135 [Candidatus Acidoferrales bacterium]|nr:hypothetical protein [Candidatus Acidoferrales bacterium]
MFSPPASTRSLGSCPHPAAGAALAIALLLLWVGAWAKTSRYRTNAEPSPHFSKSVKITRTPAGEEIELDSLGLPPDFLRLPEFSHLSPAPAPVIADVPRERFPVAPLLRGPPAVSPVLL